MVRLCWNRCCGHGQDACGIVCILVGQHLLMFHPSRPHFPLPHRPTTRGAGDRLIRGYIIRGTNYGEVAWHDSMRQFLDYVTKVIPPILRMWNPVICTVQYDILYSWATSAITGKQQYGNENWQECNVGLFMRWCSSRRRGRRRGRRRREIVSASSGIPGFAMEHYKALYSTVAPYHGSLVI